MNQYNIYAGLGGSFGGARYQFTSLCETIEEAKDEAFQAACEEYESYAGIHGLPSWEDAIADYCADNDINPDEYSGEDSEAVEEYYNEIRESWLDYSVVPTDEDNIDPEDLILGYVVEDGNSSETDSE